MARGRSIALDRPRLMGILNATPDSFFDGGRFGGLDAAIVHARRLASEGADAIDVGGESTRPGSVGVAPVTQIERVVPIVRALRADRALDAITISVDTTNAEVAREALDAGADAINDTSAGRDDPAMLALVARAGAGLVLMHRVAQPAEDHYSDRYPRPPSFGDVVREVARFLDERVRAAVDAGVAPEAIAIDPGLGFGKSVEQNLELIRRTGALLQLGRPVMSGLSRKSFVGRASLGRDSNPHERLAGTLAMSLAHVRAGARILRVHDVGAHREALAAWAACDAPP